MIDVMAELREQIEDTVIDADDLSRIQLALKLRHCADTYDYVEITLPSDKARLLAADLEELAMLRIVPPTGDDG